MFRQAVSKIDLIFRLLGYGGLGVVAATNLLLRNDAGLWLLLAWCMAWPPLWWWFVRRYPRFRSPQTGSAQFVHAAECLLVMGLVSIAGLVPWQAVAVGLLCLTGVAALGGLRLLGPCALVVSVVVLIRSRDLVQPAATDPTLLASGMLVSSFLLGIALVSFSTVQRLDVHRRRALTESADLRDRNARLARYLPDDLAPLVSARPAIVNRPVEHFATVAFVDVVGFVELVASRPVAELVDVLNDFIAIMTRLTERHGGILSKFLGDGVLVYFPERPGDPPDDRWQSAASCARFCLDLRPGLAALADTWRRRGLAIDLDTRCGIASGYCAIGDWGGGDRLDYTLIGTPVNLASRLQVEASPGGVLLSGVTADLVGADAGLAGRLNSGARRDIKGFGGCMVHALTASDKVPASRKRGPSGLDHGSHGKDLSQGL